MPTGIDKHKPSEKLLRFTGRIFHLLQAIWYISAVSALNIHKRLTAEKKIEDDNEVRGRFL